MLTTLSLALVSLSGTSCAFKTFSSSPLEKPYYQQSNDQYSPLKFLGGLGPYTSRQGSGISPEVPEGCVVDQVALVQRHGERYPSPSSIDEQRSVLDKIYNQHKGKFSGDLSFLNNWEFFLENDGDAGLEIASGPYSGYSDLHDKGSRFRARYGHLWDGETKVPLFASESQRVVDSARKFGEGFFGYNYTEIAEINIIPEDVSAGANAISPYFCDQEFTTECDVPDRTTYDGTDEVVFPQIDKAAVRLNEQHGLSLTASDVSQLFKVAAFDVSARGDSPWLNVFTADEWAAFNYQQGMWLHCYFGAGSAAGRAVGTSWANATTTLLNQGPDGSGLPLALTFGHDSEITNFLGGTGILSPLKPLDPNRIVFDSRWDISDITPMGAQLVIERLKCTAPGLTNSTDLIRTNSSLPEQLLNQSYGTFNGNDTTVGYFDPSYTNKTSSSSHIVFWNSTNNATFVNQTVVGQYLNETVVVVNGTQLGTANITSTTSKYGFDRTEGTTNEAALTDAYFVRVLLNDAVVPLDDCYDGPGYTCSLENWTKYIAEKVEENNFAEICKPEQNNVPGFIDFYWTYNHTTVEDVPEFIPWQGSYVV